MPRTIRLSSYNPNADLVFRDRLGRCYELAGRYAQHNPGSLLVHGSIQGFGKPRLAHAWVETADRQIFEPTGGKLWSAEVFAAVFNPQVDETYDEEALCKTLLRHEHWGPWDNERMAAKNSRDKEPLFPVGTRVRYIEVPAQSFVGTVRKVYPGRIGPKSRTETYVRIDSDAFPPGFDRDTLFWEKGFAKDESWRWKGAQQELTVGTRVRRRDNKGLDFDYLTSIGEDPNPIAVVLEVGPQHVRIQALPDASRDVKAFLGTGTWWPKSNCEVVGPSWRWKGAQTYDHKPAERPAGTKVAWTHPGGWYTGTVDAQDNIVPDEGCPEPRAGDIINKIWPLSDFHEGETVAIPRLDSPPDVGRINRIVKRNTTNKGDPTDEILELQLISGPSKATFEQSYPYAHHCERLTGWRWKGAQNMPQFPVGTKVTWLGQTTVWENSTLRKGDTGVVVQHKAAGETAPEVGSNGQIGSKGELFRIQFGPNSVWAPATLFQLARPWKWKRDASRPQKTRFPAVIRLGEQDVAVEQLSSPAAQALGFQHQDIPLDRGLLFPNRGQSQFHMFCVRGPLLLITLDDEMVVRGKEIRQPETPGRTVARGAGKHILEVHPAFDEWVVVGEPIGGEKRAAQTHPQAFVQDLGKTIQAAMQDPELTGLVGKLQAEHGDSFGMTSGGCFGFAETLRSVVGGQLWVVASFEDEAESGVVGGDWPVQHALLKVDGKLYDANGEISEAEAIKRFGLKGAETRIGPRAGWKNLWYPTEDEFLGPRERSLLRKVLTRYSSRPVGGARTVGGRSAAVGRRAQSDDKPLTVGSKVVNRTKDQNWGGYVGEVVEIAANDGPDYLVRYESGHRVWTHRSSLQPRSTWSWKGAQSGSQFWLDPDGQLIRCHDHKDWAYKNKLIRSRVLKPYSEMLKKGYHRVAVDYGGTGLTRCWVDCTEGVLLNSAQKAAMERFGIEHEYVIMLEQDGREQELYRPPDAPDAYRGAQYGVDEPPDDGRPVEPERCHSCGRYRKPDEQGSMRQVTSDQGDAENGPTDFEVYDAWHCDDCTTPRFAVGQRVMVRQHNDLEEGKITAVRHESYQAVDNRSPWIYRVQLTTAGDEDDKPSERWFNQIALVEKAGWKWKGAQARSTAPKFSIGDKVRYEHEPSQDSGKIGVITIRTPTTVDHLPAGWHYKVVFEDEDSRIERWCDEEFLGLVNGWKWKAAQLANRPQVTENGWLSPEGEFFPCESQDVAHGLFFINQPYHLKGFDPQPYTDELNAADEGVVVQKDFDELLAEVCDIAFQQKWLRVVAPAGWGDGTKLFVEGGEPTRAQRQFLEDEYFAREQKVPIIQDRWVSRTSHSERILFGQRERFTARLDQQYLRVPKGSRHPYGVPQAQATWFNSRTEAQQAATGAGWPSAHIEPVRRKVRLAQSEYGWRKRPVPFVVGDRVETNGEVSGAHFDVTGTGVVKRIIPGSATLFYEVKFPNGTAPFTADELKRVGIRLSQREEWIQYPAVKRESDGQITTSPLGHWDALGRAGAEGSTENFYEGFTTNLGRFVDREAAWLLAQQAGQEVRPLEDAGERLRSEDIPGAVGAEGYPAPRRGAAYDTPYGAWIDRSGGTTKVNPFQHPPVAILRFGAPPTDEDAVYEFMERKGYARLVKVAADNRYYVSGPITPAQRKALKRWAEDYEAQIIGDNAELFDFRRGEPI